MKQRMSLMAKLCMLALLFSIHASAGQWPGQRSKWNGFDRYDFIIDGRNCIVITPATAAASKPWIWRARFFGHEPQTDIALLEHGFHVAYMDVANLYGSPQAVEHWDAFYELLTKEHGLAPKVTLEGMSRGGLIVYNWAAKNPKKIACIYADAPVCDFKSWPAGKGEGRGDAPSWRTCLEAYGLTEEQALAYGHNPVDSLAPLAQAHVPLMHVCGDADVVVPIDENTRILEDRYRELGGLITVIAKHGVGHHPHSLKDPAPIVNFILRHTIGSGDYFTLRSNLDNARIKFQKQKQGRVVFLGGSITFNPGWRDMVAEYLQRRFPGTDFDFVNAGIPSMGSTPGAFRLVRDVFSQGTVDLLFVEAAVNDSSNGRSPVEQIRGMEGIVRHARSINPDIDIVMMHFVDPSKMKTINEGKVPAVIASHERVAGHYGVPSIDLALEVTQRIEAGEFTWEGDFKNLHPSQFGQRLYSATIGRMFDASWKKPLATDAKMEPHETPGRPLDAFSYFNGRLVDIKQAERGIGWSLVERWKPSDGAGTRSGFVNVPMLVAEEPGAALTLEFEGTSAGILVAAGPDAGVVEYSVDGAPYAPVDLYTLWSGGLHLPWAYVLAPELDPGKHRLNVRIGKTNNGQSKGHAARIAYFLVN